tara:strand:+ start:299 stop:2140 length:1842 start_codon:yes stop_codon:yes gene_type:complete
VISDLDGTPLENGYIYIGEPSLDPEAFPKAAFWDQGQTIPATQPVRTIAGRFVNLGSQIGNLYVEGGYSILAKDKNMITVFSADNDTDPKTSYETFPDLISDSQTFPAGQLIRVTDIGAVYQATAGTGNLGQTNAGGQEFDVLPGAGGFYNVVAFGAPTTGLLADAATVTAAIQASIDAAAGDYLGGAYGGGSVAVKIPAGAYYHTGLIIPMGVNLEDDGRFRTVLYLTGNNNTAIKNAAATSGLVADQVTHFKMSGISLAVGDATPVGQVQIDMRGFSRARFDDMWIEWCGGCTGVSCVDGVLAGAGGPAQFYNDFYNVFCERRAAKPSGGLGWDLGSNNTTEEQITTWNWFGGRTSGAGSGTGLSLRGGTGNNWFGHTFEGCDVILGGTGSRISDRNNFYGFYQEGSAAFKLELKATAKWTTFWGIFQTGATITDNGDGTQFFSGGDMQFNVRDLADKFVFNIEDNAGVNLPLFKGATPGLALQDTNGSNRFARIISSAGASATELALRFYAATAAGTLGTEILQMGTAAIKPGVDAAVSLGSITKRFSNFYLSGFLVTGSYTVATLPASPPAGAKAFVTDATAPTYLGALTGGGTVRCPVFFNGTSWVSA